MDLIANYTELKTKLGNWKKIQKKLQTEIADRNCITKRLKDEKWKKFKRQEIQSKIKSPI